jgi:copper-containing nitrite reductase
MVRYLPTQVGVFAASVFLAPVASAASVSPLREQAVLTYAPAVPPPIHRSKPAVVEVPLQAQQTVLDLGAGDKYQAWSFNGHVPGPFIRVREGDWVEVHMSSADASGMPHNIDMHAVTGPGGGAQVTAVVLGQDSVARFKMLHAGLFLYHCASPPVMDHIANGMYGLVLVEPEKGLSKVDREYYVLQSEFYTQPQEGSEVLVLSHARGLDENPTHIVFNGAFGSLMDTNALKAKTGETVRIFFGNAGPNKASAFHVIGLVFDKLFRDADLFNPPGRFIQTTLVPPGSATIVELKLDVPGTYTLLDHAIFRIEKGAVGLLQVEGADRPDIYTRLEGTKKCEGCELHP